MTAIVHLNGEVNIDSAFLLLPDAKIQVPEELKRKKKCDLPVPSQPGALLSIRYRGITRGIVRSNKNNCFRNCITVDMSNGKKNVSMKLSRGKVQICGVKSAEMAREAVELLLDKVRWVNDSVEYLQQNYEAYRQVVDWLSDSAYGEKIEESHELRLPDQVPEHLDSRIANFLINNGGDYIYYEDYIQMVEWIGSLQHIIQEPLQVASVERVMVNYNYNIGIPIIRHKLAEKIEEFDDFESKFQNTLDTGVSIVLYRDGKKHKFTVYRSGHVTQSGKEEETARSAYDRFREVINKILKEVASDEPMTLRVRAP